MCPFSAMRKPGDSIRCLCLFALSGILLFLLTGCLYTFNTNPRIQSEAFQENPPIKVAILPFVNKTNSPGAGKLARSAFFNELAGKRYEDVEITRVDDVLAQVAIETGENPLELASEFLAEKLGADALFYGSVDDVSKFYIILYSHQKVCLTVRLYDVRRKAFIFSDTVAAYNRTIAPAASPLGLVTSCIETLWHLRKSEKIQTFERLARRLVKEIPEPDISPMHRPNLLKTIEVRVPSPTLKANDAVDVMITGAPQMTATFDIGNMRRFIPMAEIKPGIYRGRYRIKKGDNLDYALIRGHLTGKTTTYEKINYRYSFRIDTSPPVSPRITTIRSTKKDFRVYISPPQDKDFAHFILYKSVISGNGYQELAKSTKPYFRRKGLKSGITYHYRVQAVDKMGNKTPLSKDFEFTAPDKGPTRLEDDFKGYTTLYAYSSPYYVNKLLMLPPDAVLFAEPGVEIRFGQTGSLLIKGVIEARGEERNRIVFTGKDGWGGVVIRSEGKLRRSRLSFVKIENAIRGIRLESGRLEAQHLEIANCSIGISAARKSSLRLADSAFQFNQTALQSDALNAIVKNCTFFNNKFITEINGVPKRQKLSKVKGFSFFRY